MLPARLRSAQTSVRGNLGSLRRVVAVATALALALTSAAVVAAAPAPAGETTAATPLLPGPFGDAFYTPPAPLPAGAPGDVIRWRPTTTAALYGLVAAQKAIAFEIMYLSRDTFDRPMAVTGTVLVPQGKLPSTLPIVGWGAFTLGVGDSCASSRQLDAGTDLDLISINNAISNGWAVAVGDYEGLGTPSGHTYMVGRSQGHSVLDSVRAAQRLPIAGLSASAKVGLWGYSQGGGAVGWAAELQPTYAPELNLVGVSAGGTPADLASTAKLLDGGPGFGFLLMAAAGLNNAYPELKVKSYLNEAGKQALADAGSKCMIEMLTTYAGKKTSDYTTKDPLAQPDWQARIAQQKLGLVAPRVPVYLNHAAQDEFIPFSQAKQLKKDWCARGAKVDWGEFTGEHVTTYLASQPDAQDFLTARFAGKATANDC
jgi:hypothetical protein